jgi:threonine dehydrogenase-like Zn-dependent dehydrogenase
VARIRQGLGIRAVRGRHPISPPVRGRPPLFGLDHVQARPSSKCIRAIIVTPGVSGAAQLTELDDPQPSDGELLVEMLAMGVCGTDREIISGQYGWPPADSEQLVLGHESLGRVRQAPNGDFQAGDLVAGIVRRPDPEPCPCCGRGEFDMCRNGRYRERGIKELHGYGSELVTLEPDYAVKLDPSLGLLGVLTEPTSVVAKAWEQIDLARFQVCRPLESVLVTGAGPIGLLAALLGAQRGFQIHVLDRTDHGPKRQLTEDLRATYHTGSVEDVCDTTEPDVLVECTGAPEVVVQAMQSTAPGAVVCLLGVSPRGRTISVDPGELNNELVLENDVVFGSVNANHRHFRAAADALATADPGWLERLITKRVPLDRWSEALERGPDDIKNVIEFASRKERSA